jgi:hypothetical protein
MQCVSVKGNRDQTGRYQKKIFGDEKRHELRPSAVRQSVPTSTG